MLDPTTHVPYNRIAARQFVSHVHRDVPASTFWGYEASCPGPTFAARQGQPILVEWANELPHQHLFPIGHTIHGAETDKPEVRTVVHLHGGRTGPGKRWLSNGGRSLARDYRRATNVWAPDTIEWAAELPISL